MKKLILCCFTLTLIACNDVKTVANNTQINSVENKAQTQKFDAQSKKLLPKDSRWQFDKFINVTDEDLKKLQSNATVSFTRGSKNIGSVGVYSGCNHGGKPMEFDDTNFRTVPPKPEKDEGYVGTAMGCIDYDATEDSFITFITDGNVYEFQGENLILTDNKGQKIQFKPDIPKNENSNPQ